jgi:hypothetical protein
MEAPVRTSLAARKAPLLESAHLGPKKGQDASAKLWRPRPERLLQTTQIGSRLLTQDDTLEQGLQTAGKTVERRPEPGHHRRSAAARPPSGAARRVSNGGGGIAPSARRGHDRPGLASDARDDGRNRVPHVAPTALASPSSDNTPRAPIFSTATFIPSPSAPPLPLTSVDKHGARGAPVRLHVAIPAGSRAQRGCVLAQKRSESRPSPATPPGVRRGRHSSGARASVLSSRTHPPQHRAPL